MTNEATNSDVGKLIADMKEAALRATPGPWRRTSTQFNGITHGPFSFTKEDVLGHFAEKCNAKFVSECDPKNVLALIAALEQAHQRNGQLKSERDALRESGLNGQANTRAAADIYFQLIEECDIPPGGSLVQHVDGMRDRIAELEAISTMREHSALCVKPLCVKLPEPHEAFNDGGSFMALYHEDVVRCIRAAGGIVEGGE